MLTSFKIGPYFAFIVLFLLIKKLHYWGAGSVFYYGISALVLFRFNTALLSVVVMFNLPLAISILKVFCL